MGRSGAGKSTLLGLLYAQRPMDVALVSEISALVKPLSMFHNVHGPARLPRDREQPLRDLASPAACEVSEVRGVLERA